jgi:hypothetical protein
VRRDALISGLCACVSQLHASESDRRVAYVAVAQANAQHEQLAEQLARLSEQHDTERTEHKRLLATLKASHEEERTRLSTQLDAALEQAARLSADGAALEAQLRNTQQDLGQKLHTLAEQKAVSERELRAQHAALRDEQAALRRQSEAERAAAHERLAAVHTETEQQRRRMANELESSQQAMAQKEDQLHRRLSKMQHLQELALGVGIGRVAEFSMGKGGSLSVKRAGSVVEKPSPEREKRPSRRLLYWELWKQKQTDLDGHWYSTGTPAAPRRSVQHEHMHEHGDLLGRARRTAAAQDGGAGGASCGT